MPAKPAQIAAGIAGALALATGGYFANEWRVCRGLEEDYLNSLADMRGTIALRSVLRDTPSAEAANKLDAIATERITSTLLDLHSRCGERSAETANRKGQDMLLGLQPG